MADTKISALGTKTAVGASDLIPIVDVADTSMSASGTDKSIVPAALFQPARFASIANASPSDGDVWYGSTQKALVGFLDGINQRFVGCLFTQTADGTVANTATATTLTASGIGTLTLPANFLVAGKTIRIRASGVLSTFSTAPNLTFTVKLGSTTVGPGSAVFTANSLSNVGWDLEFTLTCRTTGASGTVAAQGGRRVYNGSVTLYGGAGLANASPVTIDTTASLAIDLLATFSSANAANTITCTNLTVEAIN